MNNEELELLSDSKYRQFINAVDKALKNFEYSSEWADLISALGKLNKVLQSHPKFKVVPRKIMIAKRLSQCTHPALPSGVHLKALETYELIFRRLGKKGLAQDLFLYSSGLFPLLGNAAMSVKPVLMGIYEEFFVSLGKALIPCLPGFLLGLLPGIEEGSEYTNRTISILESSSQNTDMTTFYGTLWTCILSTASIRLPAVTFIMSRLNKKSAYTHDYILGDDIPMTVQSICIALADPNVLVQRSVLDFILLYLPMNSSRISTTEKVKLVASGLGVLLRRDMSLNRRLYSWLLGPENEGAGQRKDSLSSVEDSTESFKETYFVHHSISSTVEAVRLLFKCHYSSEVSVNPISGSKRTQKNEALWPFRILISLLDRPEIGSTILEDVLIESFRVLYSRCKETKDKPDELERKDSAENLDTEEESEEDATTKSKMTDELIKTANLLFNAFEPYFMWEYVCKLLSASKVSQEQTKEQQKEEAKNESSQDRQNKMEEIKIPSTTFSEVLHLTDFLLDIVALEADVETQTEHWPRLLRHIAMEMTSRCQSMSLVEIREGICLCSKLLSKVMPSMKSVEKPRTQKSMSVAGSVASENVGGSSSTETNGSPTRKPSKGRLVHVARISSGENELSGWSVVDLRKRLETGVNEAGELPSHDEDRELIESGETDDSDESDETIDKKSTSKTDDRTKEYGDSKKQEPSSKSDSNKSQIEDGNEINEDINGDVDQDDYDEWMECQESIDVNQDCVTKNDCVTEDGKFGNQSSRPNSPNRTFQPSLIQSCIDYFQSFFSEFVNQRIITPYNDVVQFAQTKNSTRRNSEFVLDELLSPTKSSKNKTPTRDEGKNNSDKNKEIEENRLDKRLPWEQENFLLCAEAFAAACRLLVELSCFPVYCTSDLVTDDNTDGKLDPRLPEWLQALIICCFRVRDFDIQSSAVGTLLDLLNLTLSVSPVSGGERPRTTVVVMVIPMISHSNLNSIEKSCIYKVVAESLWFRLRQDASRYHQRIVELFLQLHSLTPRPSLCENVITNSLIAPVKECRLDGHWKFAVFWHAARNVVIQDSGRTSRLGDVRPLDRALFIMLDSLESEDPEIRVLTKQWLAHALQHGDLGRLVDPLLVLLLHPATTRLSIQHACALDFRRKTGDSNATKDDSMSLKQTKTDRCDTQLEDSRALGASGTDIERTTDSDYEAADRSSKKRTSSKKGSKGSSKKDSNKNARHKLQMAEGKQLIHPLDQHKLLYRLIYDSRLTLYAFNTLLSILRSAPHQFVCASASCSVSSSNTPHQDKIKELLARHRRSLLGKGFYGPLYDTPVTSNGKQQSSRLFAGTLLYLKPNTSKYLEILISISLYFIRSEYPATLELDDTDVDGNTQVQMTSADVLTSIIWQLVEVVRENAGGMGAFINDLFSRCKVQKALLHCLNSTLYERTGFRTPSNRSNSEALRLRISKEVKQCQLRAFQVKLLHLLQGIFVLEDSIDSLDTGVVDSLQGGLSPQSPSKIESEPLLQSAAFHFLPGKGLAYQRMLLTAVLHGLQKDDYDLHHEWLRFVIACLPHMRGALGSWVVVVVEQVGRMLQKQTSLYAPLNSDKADVAVSGDKLCQASLPPDYVLSLLEHLGTICHFCLVDIIPTSPGLSLKPRTAPFPATTTSNLTSESSQSANSSGQIFANLLHAFSSQSSTVSQVPNSEGPKPFLEARESLLSILPSVITALVSVWSTWDPEDHESTNQRLPTESFLDLIGSPKSVRLQVLELLTPIAMNHTIIFLASLADVWHQRGKRSRQSSSKPVGPVVTRATDDQATIVNIVYALKALSFDNTIDTVKQIVRQVVTSKDKSTATQSGLEVHILQFFYHYMQKSSHNQIVNARPALISLMKEGLQLNQPPALFLLLVILQSYVQRLPLQEDKKAKKELQDITQRLIEACNTVAGSSLENAAWFRRNVAVIPQIDTTSAPDDHFSATESEISDSEPALEPLPLTRGFSSTSSHYSTQALTVMSEVLAPLLDMVFGSEEKDRVTSLLTTVMYNVTPYLKNHSPSNVPNFRACCAVVASLSGYQYMRRAWKKDVMEQVMDPIFFQMDITCIGSWRTIIDNLMTQDTTSFKDLMARVAGFSQSASINIFANREQEMEQRAHLLKKLAFVLFCSEVDQYQNYLPEIQERLAECLRLPQAPVLHEQVFLALRVLLLRMSPQHLTSLWPVIVSETVHVLLQLESDLSSDDKPQNQRMLISEALLGANGYVNYSQEKWLNLYLAACKLLDLTLSLPGDRLPQFQMYRWAFEGGEPNCSAAMVTRSNKSSENKTERVTVFKPHISRIWKLLKKRSRRPEDIVELVRVPGRPLLTMYQIKSLDQLLPFLKCLSKPKRTELMDSEDSKAKKGSQGIGLFERIVERDFLESLIAD